MNNLASRLSGHGTARRGARATGARLPHRASRASAPIIPTRLTTLLSVGVGIHAARADRGCACAVSRYVRRACGAVLGDDHPWTMIAQSNIAASLIEPAASDEALPVLGDLVPRAERAMGPTTCTRCAGSTMLGVALFLSGDPRRRDGAVTQRVRARRSSVRCRASGHARIARRTSARSRSSQAAAADEGMATLAARVRRPAPRQRTQPSGDADGGGRRLRRPRPRSATKRGRSRC